MSKVVSYKSQLFRELRRKAKKVLEIGIGIGPNLEYYVDNSEVQVFGVDPNRKMEKYARAVVVAVGLPSKNFHFIEAAQQQDPVQELTRKSEQRMEIGSNKTLRLAKQQEPKQRDFAATSLYSPHKEGDLGKVSTTRRSAARTLYCRQKKGKTG
ncbi:Uncharacterized protein TCM_004336 [Theobroma cacao]|uniref:S-adenosyl-L-methionine-dependent methyltransferases superfamily protein n=1 Tax=Theobroma cacao TaxID=3641 RepID=A0A061DPW5_THECC|nr:Uncharacterized protein TCM_004336 [Theobroma cacao]